MILIDTHMKAVNRLPPELPRAGRQPTSSGWGIWIEGVGFWIVGRVDEGSVDSGFRVRETGSKYD